MASVRVHLFKDNGEVQRIALTSFEAHWSGEKRGAFMELAHTKARFAVAFVEMEDRRPRKIIRADFMKIAVDADGGFDQKAIQDGMRQAGEMMESLFPPKDILDELRPSLARLRYQAHKWSPSPAELASLHTIVLAGK